MTVINFKEEYNFCINIQNYVMNLEFKNFAQTNWSMSENEIEFCLMYDRKFDAENQFECID